MITVNSELPESSKFL